MPRGRAGPQCPREDETRVSFFGKRSHCVYYLFVKTDQLFRTDQRSDDCGICRAICQDARALGRAGSRVIRMATSRTRVLRTIFICMTIPVAPLAVEAHMSGIRRARRALAAVT